MSNLLQAEVTDVHHWTDRLFTFKTTRDPAFRFASGQFTMIGLEVNGKPLLRAYSIASAAYEDMLEFLSIKVADGPLTSRLQHLKTGDKILVGRKATGTLLPTNLLPGKHLYLLGTGTGLAPFMSLAKDPEVYDHYEKIILIHGVRHINELAYADFLERELPEHELMGELVREKLIYYPTVTREPFVHQGRIPNIIESGQIAKDTGLPELNPAEDRVMICGSPEMLRDLKALCEKRGFAEGNTTRPGQFVIERAFADNG